MKNIFSSILIALIILNTFKCSYIISLKLSYYYNKNIEFPESMYLYTITQLASPRMNIYTYIRSDKKNTLFSMYEVYRELNESEKISYYNYTKSKSFKNISKIGRAFVKSENDIEASETFFFNLYDNKTKTHKEIEIFQLNFIFGVDLFVKNGAYFLNIGFPVINDKSLNDRFKYDLIIQLKQRKVIDGYEWFILFDNEFDKRDDVIKAEEISNLNPEIIIGTYPHYYISDKYKPNQLLKTYSDLYFWSITFKDIYLYKYSSTGEKTKLSTFVNVVEIYLDDIMIYGPMFYLTMLKTQFFSKHEACKFRKNQQFFYCEKSEQFGIKELKQFPNLYFDSVDLNYTFELTYKELFIEMNGNYYFLVTENEDESWSIGYSLLKKYQFVFNQDSRTVGFYHPDIPKEEDSDKKDEEEEEEVISDSDSDKNNTKEDSTNSDKKKDNENNDVKKHGLSIEIVILIALISAIIFLIIGIILGKFITRKLKEKKRANELDENYDYDSPRENIIN